MVTLVLQVCVCTVAGARDVTADSLSGLTTSSAGTGNQHRRELLQEAAPAPAFAMALGPEMMLQPEATPAPSNPTATKTPPPPKFSTAAVVPAITSVATLDKFLYLADFTTTQQNLFTSTIEANILQVQNVLANCTVTKVVQGSVVVSNTIAFPGADVTLAQKARDSVYAALASNSPASLASYFGNNFGTVSVADVKSTNATNPAKSGAAAFGVSLAGIMGGLTILVCTMI